MTTSWRRPVLGAGSALLVGVLAVLVGAAPARAAGDPFAQPLATSLTAPDQTVAAVFAGTTATNHFCTASIVASGGHDIALTAAHCLSGNASRYVLAPGYHDGVSPYGRWAVTAAYADARWVSGQDPHFDYAFLVVAPLGGRLVQDVVGANTLAPSPATGTPVTVTGYISGNNDEPITCTHRLAYESGYPRFWCTGYKGGTSGSPFLTSSGSTRYVTGALGGLNQGGCIATVSYSSPFTADTTALLRRADAGGPADTLPVKGPTGC